MPPKPFITAQVCPQIPLLDLLISHSPSHAGPGTQWVLHEFREKIGTDLPNQLHHLKGQALA